MTNLASAVIISAQGIDAFFSGLVKVWALVGPVVGALLGSWLTARNQRAGDRERRADDASRDSAKWNRDKTEETFRDALRAVSDYSRAASFIIWWTLLGAEGTRVAEADLEGAAEDYNNADREMERAEATLMLHDDAGAALVERARLEIKMKVEAVRVRPGVRSASTTPEQIKAVRSDLVAFTGSSLKAISDRAKELLDASENSAA